MKAAFDVKLLRSWQILSAHQTPKMRLKGGAWTRREYLVHACGHRGATIQDPGWRGADIGFLPSR